MADNTYRNFRSRDTSSRGNAGRDGADDPLAELARLIGQSDPAGERGREGWRSDTHSDAPAAEMEWAADESYADQRYQAADAYPSQRAPDSYPAQRAADPFPPLPPAPQLPRDDDYYDDRGSSQFPTAPRLHGVSEDALARAISSDDRYGDDRHPDDRHPDDRQTPSFMADHRVDTYRDDERHDDASDQPYEEEEDLDEAPASRRRSGLVMVAAVLGLAVLGTAGAFAYRAMFGGSIMPTLPPIIKAGEGPNKIVPTNPGTQAGGTNQAAGSGSEKLVSREEQPVDVQDPTKAPRVISTIPVTPPGSAPGVPSPVMAGPGGADPAFGAAPGAGAATPTPSGPKKVHTVTIRPDQMGGPPVAAAPPPPAATAAPAPRAPAAVVARGPAPTGGGSEPLALVPSAGAAPAAHPRTAAVVPSTEPASISPASPGGGYVVQVTSQRSEAEAKSAYHAMKTKYPDQLGNREAMIRRADLGAKGTFYRAVVGPFVSMEEAAGLCSGLKAAGGNCIVQKN
jgi:SPOR domain